MTAQILALETSSEAGRMYQALRLEALFDAHHRRLYRLARRLCDTHEDARDVVQDTYLRAAQKLGSSFGPFLVSRARSRARRTPR